MSKIYRWTLYCTYTPGVNWRVVRIVSLPFGIKVVQTVKVRKLLRIPSTIKVRPGLFVNPRAALFGKRKK